MIQRHRKLLILVGLAAIVLVLDQWTKQVVISRFRLGEVEPVIRGFFDLHYIRNTGAAFGILAQADPSFRVPFFIIMPVLALLAIGYIFRKTPPTDVRMTSALALVVGGAVGNLIDRVRFGYVVDFLDFYWGDNHFPAFNVADSAICIGVGLLMLDLFQARDPAGAPAAPAPTERT